LGVEGGLLAIFLGLGHDLGLGACRVWGLGGVDKGLKWVFRGLENGFFGVRNRILWGLEKWVEGLRGLGLGKFDPAFFEKISRKFF
jgi:hypothetical protein